MQFLQIIVERPILSSRWSLAVFYPGLVAALVLYGVSFLFKFLKAVIVYDGADMILAVSGLGDTAFVAGLVGVEMMFGYENFLSRFGEAEIARL
ncbi:YqhA family protein [Sinorhizobium alkalisoli]